MKPGLLRHLPLVWLRAGALALLSLVVGPSGYARADEDLTTLMQRLAERRHGHAAFVEQQFIALLERPLESSGELLYDAPDRLEKRTRAPKPESLVLENGVLTIRRGAHQYMLLLRDTPQIAPFIDSIRATLAGDLAALDRTYRVEFSAVAQNWALVLSPRDTKLAGLIKRIRIAGSNDAIRTVEIERIDGDRSVMTISALPEG